MAAHLSYGKVNLNILREAARKDLREFLDKCAGSKVRSRLIAHCMTLNYCICIELSSFNHSLNVFIKMIISV